MIMSKKLIGRSQWLLAGDMYLLLSAMDENNLSVLTVA